MVKRIFKVILLVFMLSSCNNTLHEGKYMTNFSTYGMFSTSIELNCDSTFVKRFVGDMMDDISYGRWSVSGDTLILSYDSLAYERQRYAGKEYIRTKMGNLKTLWIKTLKKD